MPLIPGSSRPSSNWDSGDQEISEIVNKNGELYFRLMRPLKATERCLGLPFSDDYTPGEVAGGISVTLPMASVVGAWQRTKWAVIMAHGFLWLVGLLGLGFGARQLQKKIQGKQEIETALRQSEGKFRLLVKNIPALVYRGYADGRVDFVDDKVEKLTGYSQEQFSTGHIKWPDIILPEDRAGKQKNFSAGIKNRWCLPPGIPDQEKRWRNHLGCRKKSDCLVMPKGEIEFVSGVVFDISLQKEMEHSLKESERFWRTLLEAVGVGLMVIDKVNGGLPRSIPRLWPCSGYGREQIIGQDRQRFFHLSPTSRKYPKKKGGHRKPFRMPTD